MERIIRNKGIIAGILVAVLLFWTISISAEEPGKEGKKPEKVLKVITGEVSGVGTGFIAIEYGTDPETGAALEIALPLKKNAQFMGIKSLKDLQPGDKVTVQYEEEVIVTQEKVKDENGREKEETRKTRGKREATIVKFVSRPQTDVYTENE